jgi:DNA ligase D-like protein (predicted 3'-phosphoesterase)
MNDRLDDYRQRRDFRRTSEPSGDSGAVGDASRRYVVQQHDASSEHWDLRLEHRGVLLSWAVPKGPSTDPRERRLAVRTEDHPLDYADYEGTIPEGEYGAGSVIVWDTGTWTPRHETDDTDESDDDEDDRVDRALSDGHLSFIVEGEKLQGGYTLQRLRGDDDQWLLIKQRDDGADARRKPTSTEPESVLSGRTVDDVAAGGGRG